MRSIAVFSTKLLLLNVYFQTVEYRINKGVLGLTKELNHKVWEFKGPTVAPHSTRSFHDLHKYLQVPVMPPTLADVCKVIEMYYLLKVISDIILRVYAYIPYFRMCACFFFWRDHSGHT